MSSNYPQLQIIVQILTGIFKWETKLVAFWSGLHKKPGGIPDMQVEDLTVKKTVI